MRSSNDAARLKAMLVVGLCLAGLIAACGERTPARFPHRLHLTGLGCGRPGEPECLSCNGCHKPSGVDRAHKLPSVAVCDRCHGSEHDEMRRVVALPPDRPDGEIGFDHDRHLSLAGIGGQCVPCHAGVVERNVPDIPPMKKCFSCHEHQAEWDRGECTPCHQRKDLVRLLPRTFAKHEGDFIRNHGQAAREDGRLCRSCHAQTDCDACHDVTQALAVETRRPEAIEQSFVHRGDFMVRHAIEAQAAPARCLGCHEPSSCDGCHVERGVSGNGVGGRNPHPAGWVGGDPGSRDFHGTAARRDVALCASCHDQGPATNCITCHKVGAYGGNPHPPGFRTTQRTNDGMCRYCHE